MILVSQFWRYTTNYVLYAIHYINDSQKYNGMENTKNSNNSVIGLRQYSKMKNTCGFFVSKNLDGHLIVVESDTVLAVDMVQTQ